MNWPGARPAIEASPSSRRPSHWGLARNIIGGVTEVSARLGASIVLEDDMVTSPWFLTYMNQALDYYEDEERVASIHGYLYPVRAVLPETFFLRGANCCWGWGTWHRAWRVFNPDGAFLLGELRRRALTSLFDFGDTFGYTRLLEGQIAGTNDSWALRWYASAFLENMLTLYPCRSLAQNIGHDGSGHHRTRTHSFDVRIEQGPVRVGRCPVEDSAIGRAAFEAYFRSQCTRFPRLRAFVRERAPSALIKMVRMARLTGR